MHKPTRDAAYRRSLEGAALGGAGEGVARGPANRRDRLIPVPARFMAPGICAGRTVSL